MEQRTCNIIMCCKGHCKLAGENAPPLEAIAVYMSAECACPKEDYTGKLMETILREALFDYMAGADKPGYTGFIFQNRYGDPLSPHSVNRAIDRICAAYIEDETVLADQEGRDPVLIRHFSAHNLRHTFCTRFCENERNIKVIQEIMGHADIETTMNIYAEATKEKKKESFSNLEGKIKIS